MKKLNEAEFSIGNWQVIPAEGTLMRADEVIHIEPKVMEVLVYFASRPDEVISRDELERDVWHGAIVGYDSMTATIIKLRKALQDNAKQPSFIATVPKRGYRLIAPIKYINNSDMTERISPIITNDITQSSQQEKFNKKSQFRLASVIVLLLGGLGVWLIYDQFDTENILRLPSVIVLPFENLGSDTIHDNFVDGITEDIITDLSSMSNLLVLSSNTSFRYKNRKIIPKEVRKELNVDFLLKGSIRRAGDSIRFNVQLIDTKTGFNTWATRYDKKLTKVFDVQDELVNSVVKALAIKMTIQEKQRLEHNTTLNLKAYDFFQEGLKISKVSTKEAHKQARIVFRKAIELDSSYGRAYGAIAYSLALDFRRGWSDTPIETLDRALALAEQAVLLNKNIPQTYWALGYVYFMRKEFDKAKNAVAQAILIAPNYADGYGLLALINNNLGHSKKSIELITKGMRLNPYYTWDYLFNLGHAYYMLGESDSAIKVLEKAQERNENAIPVKLYLAASYVKAKRQDDAEWVVEQLLTLSPALTITHTAKTIPIVNPKLKNMLLEDLRLAGIPE